MPVTVYRTPPSTVPTPNSSHEPTVSAREALRRPENLRGRLIRLLVVIGSFVLLGVGWRVTQIDFPKLITGLPASQHIFRGLVTPDLVVREVEKTQVSAPFVVGQASASSASAPGPNGAELRVSPAAVQPGQEVSFRGTGFAPSSPGVLTLDTSVGRGRRISDVETDARGNFDLAFPWPEGVAAGEYRVSLEVNVPTGRWLPSEPLLLSLSKIGETILLALMGTVFGVIISVPMSFFGAHNLMRGSALTEAIYYVVRTVFNLGRSIEVLILAVIMAVVVGIGPFAGVMAIVLHSIGAMGKLYSESIESIDAGPIEAVTATGASRFQSVLYAVVPQIVPQFLAFTMYRWDINVRMSTVIGLVGGGGIGYLLIQYINLLQWSQAATALWLIAIVVMAMDYFSAWLRAKLI